MQLLISQPSQLFTPLCFFLLIITLFPLAISPSFNLLSHIGVGALWIAVLLANQLHLPFLFQQDIDDGSFAYLMLSPVQLSTYITAKCLICWMVTTLPLLVVLPLAMPLLAIPLTKLPLLMLSLSLGTPLLTLLYACMASLTLGVRRDQHVLSLLTLPFAIPIIIFATAMIDPAHTKSAGLTLLGFFLVLAPVLGFFCTLSLKSLLRNG